MSCGVPAGRPVRWTPDDVRDGLPLGSVEWSADRRSSGRRRRGNGRRTPRTRCTRSCRSGSTASLAEGPRRSTRTTASSRAWTQSRSAGVPSLGTQDIGDRRASGSPSRTSSGVHRTGLPAGTPQDMRRPQASTSHVLLSVVGSSRVWIRWAATSRSLMWWSWENRRSTSYARSASTP